MELPTIIGRILNGEYDSLLIVLVGEDDEAVTYMDISHDIRDIMQGLEQVMDINGVKQEQVN